MSERNFEVVKNQLEKDRRVKLLGEVLKFSDDYRWPESVHFYVAPVRPILFEPTQLGKFVDKLKLPLIRGSIQVGPNWRSHTLADNKGKVNSLVLGSLSYSDHLESVRDIIDPDGYFRYLYDRGSRPVINKFHSKRGIWVHAYPYARYARQVFEYKQSGDSNPQLDWLSHDITEEQIAYLLSLGRANARLVDLPEVPALKTDFTGK